MRDPSSLAEMAAIVCRALGPGADRDAICTDVTAWLDAMIHQTPRLASTRDLVLARITSLAVPPGGMVGAICALRRPLAAYATAQSLEVDADQMIDRELAWFVERHCTAAIAANQRGSERARVASIQTLTTGFAHELRNPINAARLQLEVLERELRRDEGVASTYERRLGTIEHELHRVTTLLDEFLAFAKPSELALRDHDITALAREVLAGEAGRAKERGVIVAPVEAPPITGRVDAPKVRRVLVHLVRNAIEASEPGGVVTLAVAAIPGFIHIEVDDTGAGVAGDITHRIYEPFFTTKHEGTGLGLAISRSIASAHGGSVELRPTDRGAKFRVTLPR